MTTVLRHLRRNALPAMLVLVVLALGAGGGYAVASSNTKTITVCADKKTGVLHLKTRGGRCKRGQKRVTWNQQGPQGVQGPAGTPAVSIWAQVTNDGSLGPGQGLSVQHVSAGTYQVTITSPVCFDRSNAPVVTVSDAPPAGQPTTTFPVAWFTSTGPNDQFDVYTGVVTNGTFTASDHTFTVMDTCM